MSIRKEFEKWIAKNFKGLSAYTLGQFLRIEEGFCTEYIDEMIYVELYKVFTKQATDKESNNFEYIKWAVENCAWL